RDIVAVEVRDISKHRGTLRRRYWRRLRLKSLNVDAIANQPAVCRAGAFGYRVNTQGQNQVKYASQEQRLCDLSEFHHSATKEKNPKRFRKDEKHFPTGKLQIAQIGSVSVCSRGSSLFLLRS